MCVENLTRLRALGGYVGLGVGPPSVRSTIQLRETIEFVASIPFLGRAGYEGIGLGTDFLGLDSTLPGLGNVEGVLEWVRASFDLEPARTLGHGNGRRLIERLVGIPDVSPTQG